MEKTTLINIGGGRAQDVFARELETVLENIADPRTPAKAKRSIVLTITFEPTETRGQLMTSIRAKSKIAKPGESKTLVWASLQDDGIAAFNQDPSEQNLLGDFTKARERAVAGAHTPKA